MTLIQLAGRARVARRGTTLAALITAFCMAIGLVPTPAAAADVVVAGSQEVQGSQCIGLECQEGESFGLATQILKSTNPRILFNDVSVTPGFPTENWALVASSSTFGGASYFGLADLGATETDVTNPATMPFQVMAGAPNTALLIAANGDVSVGSGNLQSAGALEQNADPARQSEAQNVDATQILNQVAALPLSTWAYQGDAAGGRHIGPSAADFKAAFGLGSSTPYIAPADMGGVALASIQALKSSFDAQAGKTELEIQGLNSAIQGLTSSSGGQSTGTSLALNKIRKLEKQNRKLGQRLKRLEQAVFHK